MTPNPKIDVNYLQPYVSFLVFVQREERGSVDIVVRSMRAGIDSVGNVNVHRDGLRYGRGVLQPKNVAIPLAVAYEASSMPSWWSGISGMDAEIQQHLALVITYEDLIAVYATESKVKDRLLAKQSKSELGGVGLLKRPALEEALAQGTIRSFVMGHGAARHGRPAPESKITYGNQLEETTDGIEDQHHTLAGIRASADENILGTGREGSVGVNYNKSGFWLHRPATWSEFLDVTEHSLGAIQSVLDSGGGKERFVTFARFIDEIDEAEDAYDLSFMVPGIDPDAGDSDEAIDAHDWFTRHTASLEGKGKHSLDVVVADDDGLSCTITVRPRKVGDSINIEALAVGGDSTVAARALACLRKLDPVLYYASGHSVSGSGVVAQHLGDAQFHGWQFVDLDRYDVGTEKPGDQSRSDIQRLGGTEDDKSLFGWVIGNSQSGWLYCDDGSDELADFIHLDNEEDRLTIWHVKACNPSKQRRMAAVPYYEVCLQAQKNVTSLDPRRIARELELRRDANDVGPLWQNGTLSGDLTQFIHDLRKPRASLEIVAALLQPHVTEKVLLDTRSRKEDEGPKGDVPRLRRLEHMLLSTHDSVQKATHARLTVVTAIKP